MGGVSELIAGFDAIFTVGNLLWLCVGAAVGMVVGIFPGLGPTAGIAILLPLTVGMNPTSAIIMLAAIYYGTMYGATVTAIMINTPGAAAVVASTFDGYPLAQQGRAGPALVMQAFASFAGGTVGVIMLTLLTPTFAKLARSFGPVEFLLVVLVGLLTLILLVGEEKIKGVVSALVGFALATAGVDLGTGASRFTFGSSDLIDGLNFVPIAIGLFGIGEIFYVMYTGLHRTGYEIIDQDKRVSIWPTREDWKYSRWTFGSGSIIGFVIGVVPGAGATVASLVAYSFERSVSKIKHLFGKGAMPGLVAPEAANNASTAGAMIPLLTLGLPGSASTAVLLGAFILWGLQPGPLLMVQEPEFAWGLISSMYLGNIILVIMCIVGIPLFVRILKVPYRILLPAIVVLCGIGAYSVNASPVELWLAMLFGGVGFFMKLHGYSPASLVVALVLAPLAESSFRQSLIVSGGDPMWVLERPIARWLLIALVVVLLAKPLMRLVGLVLGARGRKLPSLQGEEGQQLETGSADITDEDMTGVRHSSGHRSGESDLPPDATSDPRR